MKRILKKLSAIFISLSVVLSLGISVSAAEFENAEAAVSNITAGWNLGNALDPSGDWINKESVSNFETAWGNPVTTAEMIKVVKNAGFNAVRVPVTYTGHLDNDGNIDKEWIDRVEDVIGYVLDEGMYCILNIHHDTGTDGWLRASEKNYDSISALFKKLWEQLSARFKNYGEKLMFEGYNEILDDNSNWSSTDDASYEAANKLNQLFVDTVRASGGNNKIRNLVVNTYSASWTEKTLSSFVLPKDTEKKRLIVEVHNYEPQGFASDWAATRTEWNGTDNEKNELDSSFDLIKKYADKYQTPFIIGEWGSINQNNEADRARHASYFVSAAKERGIKCFYWDDGSFYKMLDRINLNFAYPDLARAITKASQSEVTLTAPELKIKKSGNKITLTWSAVIGAEKYYVFLYNKSQNLYYKIASVNGTSKTFANLEAGTYKYKVTAVADKKGPTSNAVTATLK